MRADQLARAMAMAQQQAPPKQIVYPVAQVEIRPAPDGNLLLVFTAPGEQLVFPMTAEAAEAIGKALSAPSIIPAPASNGKLN